MKDERDSDLSILQHLKFDLLISELSTVRKLYLYSLSTKSNQPSKHLLR